MIRLNKVTNIIFFIFLFSPLLAYIYIVWLKMPKNINVFFTFFFLIFGLVFITIKKYNLIFPTFTKYLLVFAIYIAFTHYLFGEERYFLTQIYYYILHFSIFFTTIIIYNSHFSDKFIKYSIQIIKITVITAAIVSIIQVFDFSFLDATRYFVKEGEPDWDHNHETLYQFRRVSIFGFIEPLALGLGFIPLLSILLGYLLYTNKSYIHFLFAGGMVAFLSNTRFIMLGFLLLSFQIIVYYKIRTKLLLKYTIAFMVSVIVTALIMKYLGYDFKEWYESRLLSEGDITETTRYKAFGNFIKYFPEKPIFGTGGLTEEIRLASEAVGSSHIHVGYLSHLVYYGIVGCFFLYGFWYLMLRKLYKTAKQTGYWGSFFGFFTFLWAFATMSQSSIFYYGLLFCLVFDKYFRDNQKSVMSNCSNTNI